MSQLYPRVTSFETAYDDGYDHGLRGLPSGCSYYHVGTALHREYMRGHHCGLVERMNRLVKTEMERANA